METAGTLSDYAVPELVHLLGRRFRDYRRRARLTQKDVAEKTGISTVTIYKFENGTSGNLSLGTFILLLKAIGWIDGIDRILPELPQSPYEGASVSGRTIRRIRHKKP